MVFSETEPNLVDPVEHHWEAPAGTPERVLEVLAAVERGEIDLLGVTPAEVSELKTDTARLAPDKLPDLPEALRAYVEAQNGYKHSQGELVNTEA